MDHHPALRITPADLKYLDEFGTTSYEPPPDGLKGGKD